jgi:hypothetical protein
VHCSEVPREKAEIDGPDAILQPLDEQPFSSLSQIAKRFLLPTSTVQYHLVKRMAFRLRHCKWVPHRLSDVQQRTQVATSGSLLDRLRSFQHQGRQYFVTWSIQAAYSSPSSFSCPNATLRLHAIIPIWIIRKFVAVRLSRLHHNSRGRNRPSQASVPSSVESALPASWRI